MDNIEKEIKEGKYRAIDISQSPSVKSSVWKRFKRVVDENDKSLNYAVCNICLGIVSYPPAHGTSGLWKHKCVKQEQEAAAAKIAEGDIGDDVIVPLPKRRQKSLSNSKSKKVMIDNRKMPQEISGNYFQARSDINEFDAFGIFVSKKLQRMEPTQAIFAESLINVVLRKGQLAILTQNTEVTETEPAVEPHIVEYGTEFQES